MKRSMTVAVLAMVLVVGSAGATSADPKFEPFEVTCTDGIPGGSVVAPENDAALWTPGLAVASTGVYIPYAFEFSATFFGDDGSVIDFGGESFMKNAPKNTKSHLHGVCTFGGEERLEDDPDLGSGLIVFEASASVFWTGKPKPPTP